MSTTDELLEEMLEDVEEYATPVTDDDLQFWIDEHLRVISIPKNGVVAGVEGDKNVNKIKFGMNRYYHGFDMSTFSGRILYSNAKGNKNYYNITDMQASGSAITFSWLVDADAVQYMGKTAFVVYLFKIQGSELRQKFYSTLATLKVLEGMEVDSAVPVEKQTDIIERMKEEISAYAEEVKKSLPADYTAMTEQVSSLKEDLVGLKNINNILDYRKIDNVSILTTGNIEIVDNWYTTDFINVAGCNEYFVNGTWKKPSNPKYASVIYFDSELNVLKFINEIGTQTYNMEKISFPINTVYVRFCFSKESTVQIFMDIPSMNERVGLKTAKAIFNHKITNGGTVDKNDSFVTSNLIPINNETNFITVKKGKFVDDKSFFYISFWKRPSTSSRLLVKGYQNYLLSENFTNIKIPNGAKYFCFSWQKKDYPPMYKQDSDISENNTPIDVIGKYMTVNAHNYNYRICLIGDSITQGMGSSGFQQYNAVIDGQTYNVRGNGPNNPNATSDYKIGEYLWTSGGRRWYEALDGNGWAQLFKNYMNEKFNIIVRNFGMSGIDSENLKYFINNFMDTYYNFDCIVLMIGTNDRQYANLESFYTNINDTIKTIKNYGKDLIIMACIPASIENEKEFRIHMEDIHNALRNISCENKIPFISVYNLFIDYCSNKGITIDSLLSDGLHPNDNGYQVMFQLISNAMGIALKRPNATW